MSTSPQQNRSVKNYTAWAIVLLLVLISCGDYLVYRIYGAESTISDVLRALGDNWGMFPYLFAFALGTLFGHIFLGREVK